MVASLFLLYKVGRTVADGDVSTALGNARDVLHLESALNLPSELALQSHFLDFTWLVQAANVYYAWVHFPATVAFLVWVYAYRHHVYSLVRNWLALVTLGATVGHMAFPLAPPRMLNASGFVDTAAVYGPSVYSAPDVDSFANQYAAMPSLHVAWAFIVGMGIVAMTRSRWRWWALAHPAITTLVVVATANHFWLDAVVAVALLAVTVPLVVGIEARRLTAELLPPPVFVEAGHTPGPTAAQPQDRAGALRSTAVDTINPHARPQRPFVPQQVDGRRVACLDDDGLFDEDPRRGSTADTG